MSKPDAPALLPSRGLLAVLTALAIAGVALGWNKGQLPRRDAEPAAAAPDLLLYGEVTDEVRRGKNYYDVARVKIPQFGFPIASPLNWRLPTYAWLFASLPGARWGQAVLVLLSLAALVLAYKAQAKTSPGLVAALTVLALVGVLRWALDGDAYLAQEPWAATLIALSLAMHGLGGRWRAASVAAGIAALLFRELALPYCGIACLMAAWNFRWRECSGWAAGIVLFFGFFAWHVGQVRWQLAGAQAAVAGAGLTQWLRCGGLDFVLLTTRMNGLVFNAPAALVWLYILASLLGLAHRGDETSRLACLAALAYLQAFAILGRPENFYWGLLPAPLLAWGTASSPAALAALWKSASAGQPCDQPALAESVSIASQR